MITLVILALGAITGCDSFKSCDTADTGECTSGDGSAPIIQEYAYTCDGATCTWTVITDGEVGNVELTMIETGDDIEAGCTEADIGRGGFVCDVWTEYHNSFTLSELNNSYGGESKEIVLTIEPTYETQVSNDSTIFDMSDAAIERQLTYEFSISDASGNYADCLQAGHDTTFFNCQYVSE